MDLQRAKEALLAKGELILYIPEKMGVTQSTLNTWMDCDKKARYYLRGLTSAGGSLSPALSFGSIFHDYQEYILTANMHGDKWARSSEGVSDHMLTIQQTILENKWKAIAKELNATSKDNINYAFDFMQELIPRYFEFYKEDFNDFIYTQVEKQFKVNIHNMPIRGMRDGMFCSLSKQGEYLMEHKTKSRYDVHALQRMLPQNFQVNVYALTHYLETGEMLKGVCYNVIRKPALRKKVSESSKAFINRCMVDIDSRPDYYFQRFWHDFDMTQMAVFNMSFSNQIMKYKMWVAQAEELDVYNTAKCQGMYGACQYLDYCSSGETDVATLDIKDKLFSELN